MAKRKSSTKTKQVAEVARMEIWAPYLTEIASYEYVGLDELDGTLLLVFKSKNSLTFNRVSIPATAVTTAEKGKRWLDQILEVPNA